MFSSRISLYFPTEVFAYFQRYYIILKFFIAIDIHNSSLSSCNNIIIARALLLIHEDVRVICKKGIIKITYLRLIYFIPIKRLIVTVILSFYLLRNIFIIYFKQSIFEKERLIFLRRNHWESICSLWRRKDGGR